MSKLIKRTLCKLMINPPQTDQNRTIHILQIHIISQISNVNFKCVTSGRFGYEAGVELHPSYLHYIYWFHSCCGWIAIIPEACADQWTAINHRNHRAAVYTKPCTCCLVLMKVKIISYHDTVLWSGTGHPSIHPYECTYVCLSVHQHVMQ